MQIHIPTVYLFVGVLFLLLPSVVWIVLSGQRSSTVVNWCLGGVLVGAGLFLFGFRSVLPAWATYSMGNYAMWIGNMLVIFALAQMLSYQPRARWFVFAFVGSALVFEFFRIGLESAFLRFLWATIMMVVLMSALGFLSSRLGQVEGVHSAHWLALTYWSCVLLLLGRIYLVSIDNSLSEAMASGVGAQLITMAGLLLVVLGNFSFVAVYLERASHQVVVASQEQARKEEADRLRVQIAQLERQRTLGAMSSSFAHELSQPMTAILMDAQNAKQALEDRPVNALAAQQSVREIESSAERVVALVNRIRNFIRHSPVSREKVDLQELAQEVLQLLAHDIRRDNVMFEFEFEPGSWCISADRVQLSQIFLNVYRNAIQAMSHAHQKTIFVTGEFSDKMAVVRIQDSGPGLSEDLKGKVGTPFITSKPEGLGVGFSISKAIA